MSITVVCPNCGRAYAVANQFAGKSARCKACQSKMTVPMADPVRAGTGRPASSGASRAARATTAAGSSSARKASQPSNNDPMDLLSLAAAMEQSAEIADEPVVAPTATKPRRTNAVPPEIPPAPSLSRPRGTVYRPPAQLQYGRAPQTAGGFSLGPAVDNYLPSALITIGLIGPLIMNLMVQSRMNIQGMVVLSVLQLFFVAAIFTPFGLLGFRMAGRIMNFELPDGGYKRMAAVICVPAASGVLGYVLGGSTGALLCTLLGLVLTYPILVLLMHVGFLQGLVGWLFMGLSFFLGLLGFAFVMGILKSIVQGVAGAAR